MLDKLNEAHMEKIRRTSLGHLLDMNTTNLKFALQVLHHVLLQEVPQPNEDEMWFKTESKDYRLSKNEWAFITGLSCIPSWTKQPSNYGIPSAPLET